MGSQRSTRLREGLRCLAGAGTVPQVIDAGRGLSTRLALLGVVRAFFPPLHHTHQVRNGLSISAEYLSQKKGFFLERMAAQTLLPSRDNGSSGAGCCPMAELSEGPRAL